MDEVHIHCDLSGGHLADRQRATGLVPLKVVAQLFPIDGFEQVHRDLDAVFCDRRALRKRIDLSSLGHRLAVRTEDVGDVADGELVGLVHGTQLELASQVGDDGMEREQRAQGGHRIGDGKSAVGAEVEGGDPRFPDRQSLRVPRRLRGPERERRQ